MSENPERICITPSELYLMLQWDRMFWKLGDMLEEFKEDLNKKLPKNVKKRRLKTFSIVVLYLMRGVPRNEIVRMLVESGLYKESYAEKAVRKYERILRTKLHEFTLYRLRAQPKKTEKGRWGRHESEKKAGRPPLVYSVERPPNLVKMEMDERLGRLIGYATMLSGSYPRLIKILLRMGFELGILDEFIRWLNKCTPPSEGYNLQLPNLKPEDIEKLEKGVEYHFNSLVEPVRKEDLDPEPRPLG